LTTVIATYQETKSPGSSTAAWMRENTFRVRFTDEELHAANQDWGCNCGPASLAAICGLSLKEARLCLGEFEHKGYMNVRMMRAAIAAAGWTITHEARVSSESQMWPLGKLGLVRVQWGGPWIIDGKPTRWASCYSHWVGAVRGPADITYVYDINSGLVSYGEWERGVVPLILRECVPRNDGTFFLSHAWSVEKAGEST
jgi:hypothetical protein